MGTSVATELFARDIAGELGVRGRRALLFNGSMILDAASPDPRPEAARSRPGRSPPGSLGALLQRPVRLGFSPDHPLSDEEEADQWSLITDSGGAPDRPPPVHLHGRAGSTPSAGTARSATGRPLSFAWGMLDPVATPDVLGGCASCAPAAPVTEFPELGHYPQIEDPAASPRAAQARRCRVLSLLTAGPALAIMPRSGRPGRCLRRRLQQGPLFWALSRGPHSVIPPKRGEDQ